MGDARLVGALQALRHLRGNVERFLDRQRPAFDFLLQGLAGIVGHDNEQLPFSSLANFVNGADVRMVEGRGRLRLIHEAIDRLGVVR